MAKDNKNKQFKELSDDELKQVTGGELSNIDKNIDNCITDAVTGIKHCASED